MVESVGMELAGGWPWGRDRLGRSPGGEAGIGVRLQPA